MLIRNVEVEGKIVDVRVDDARIALLGRNLDAAQHETIVEGRGGALLPGLHDHHIHLYALAAARKSVRCGPPDVTNESALRATLRAAADHAGSSSSWIRGVGYHESVAGELDALRLDSLVPKHPIRIQHRSGALWIVNQAGLEALGLGGPVPEDAPSGVERDADGRATGRLLRVDDWLRERLGPAQRPDLTEVGASLARFGVTGVTDATPSNDSATLAAFSEAVDRGELRQRVRVMGLPELPEPQHSGVSLGPVKLVLSEYELIDFDALRCSIGQAHDAGRPVAIHCVTRAELALAVGAFASMGTVPQDRIEHASIAPPDLAEQLSSLGLSVVTQPNFVRERGDAYLQDVDEVDRPWLYRCRGLLDAGVSLGAGTDAPFGNPDPWLAMQAALDRRTATGATLGASEALSPERALALFTTRADAPGGAPRRIAEGEPADLCLLGRPWSRAREDLSSDDVIFTCSRGIPSYEPVDV